MTNLTKERRALIVDSVINRGTTLPQQKEDLIKRTCQRVRKISLSLVPQEFIDATKNMPAEWFQHIAGESLYQKINPAAIVMHSTEEVERNSYWGYRLDFEPFRYPAHVRFHRENYARRPGSKQDDPESWEVLLADLIVEAKKIRATEDKLRDELMAFLMSVKTYKQVLEKMPELERHLPAASGAKAYPVVVSTTKLVGLLDKLGFDQGEGDKKVA